mmetsp:Transcript_12575/g.21836  ORF Transcript_12575/g.21836 Transcript_12575/m.21836 type:complete len:343 (+) Transcript_12575:98-1126(+)
MAAISEGEVAVYDRQLRLWGVQAQQRLLKSKVLVWGIEGSSVEVCKNLVLAGVNLTVRDHRPVADADVAFNYFLRTEDVGSKRAERVAAKLQEMNPLNTVGASSGSFSEGSDWELKDYDVVLLSLGVLDWDVSRALAINQYCRKAGICFFLPISAGELAFFFSDLKEHTVQERSSAQGGSAAPEATPKEPAAPETLSFPSLSEWAQCAPKQLQEQKVDASVLLFSLFVNFLHKSDGTLKIGADAAGRFEEFCSTEKCMPIIDGIVGLKEVYSLFFMEPLVHVASIAGGLLAQEVIKAITKRDPPMMNCVCFNANTSAALVERIPAPQAPKKRKVVEETFDLD